MPTFALKVWTGPSGVREVADKFIAAGFQSVSTGTEHVYFTAEGTTPEGAAWDAGVYIEQKIGWTWMRPRPV